VSLVAGVDVGNCNTEIVIARYETDGLEPVWHGQAPTTGRKGSHESLIGALTLLRRGESEIGTSVDLVALAELRPVDTIGFPLRPSPPSPLPVRNLCRGDNETPAGLGTAVGRHVPLHGLARSPRSGSVIVSVPERVDFEDAARQLGEAWRGGWRIVGVVVAKDDAVLIHHRIPFDVPIVDEVEVDALRDGDPVALEVVAPGVLRRTFADPLALIDALGLTETDYEALARATREFADSAALALTPSRGDSEVISDDTDFATCEVNGESRRYTITDAAALMATRPPGCVRELSIAARGRDVIETSDALLVNLATVDDGAWLRRGTVSLDRVVAALLSRDVALNAADHLATSAARRVVTVGNESSAAALGASSTPAFPPDAAVCDIGAGTVDLVWRGESVTGAGGGDIVTLAVASALNISSGLAERVKRSASVRVENPHVVHEEDGRRVFLSSRASNRTVGRLCVREDGVLVDFSDRLAPEEWRSLRLAIKQSTVGANIARCLSAFSATPSALVIAGGGALDDELVRSVGENLRARGVMVGRANVAGRFGPRYAVAWGLVQRATAAGCTTE
jgi:hypothetical protein